MNTHLGEVCVGLKQSKKAVMNGEAKMIYLAHDADRNIKETFEKLCKKAKIEADSTYSLAQLGELCSIDVGAAVVAVLKSV
jgi:large subunit ribosomal protein L7A